MEQAGKREEASTSGQFLTRPQVAAMLAVSVETVDMLVAQLGFPVKKLNDETMFDATEVERWLNESLRKVKSCRQEGALERVL